MEAGYNRQDVVQLSGRSTPSSGGAAARPGGGCQTRHRARAGFLADCLGGGGGTGVIKK